MADTIKIQEIARQLAEAASVIDGVVSSAANVVSKIRRQRQENLSTHKAQLQALGLKGRASFDLLGLRAREAHQWFREMSSEVIEEQFDNLENKFWRTGEKFFELQDRMFGGSGSLMFALGSQAINLGLDGDRDSLIATTLLLKELKDKSDSVDKIVRKLTKIIVSAVDVAKRSDNG